MKCRSDLHQEHKQRHKEWTSHISDFDISLTPTILRHNHSHVWRPKQFSKKKNILFLALFVNPSASSSKHKNSRQWQNSIYAKSDTNTTASLRIHTGESTSSHKATNLTVKATTTTTNQHFEPQTWCHCYNYENHATYRLTCTTNSMTKSFAKKTGKQTGRVSPGGCRPFVVKW